MYAIFNETNKIKNHFKLSIAQFYKMNVDFDKIVQYFKKMFYKYIYNKSIFDKSGSP